MSKHAKGWKTNYKGVPPEKRAGEHRAMKTCDNCNYCTDTWKGKIPIRCDGCGGLTR